MHSADYGVARCMSVRHTPVLCLNGYIQGGPKNRPPPYSFAYSAAVLLTFTNNTPCELKLCSTYIEAQTKLVCQQVVQKNYKRVIAPEHYYVTMAKHKSNAMHAYGLCLCLSNNSIQQQTVK